MFKQLLSAFCVLNFASANFIQGNLLLDYRWDTIKQVGVSNIEISDSSNFGLTMSHFDREISNIDIIGGTAIIQGFFDIGPYFKARGNFGWIVRDVHNNFQHTLNGVKSTGCVNLSGTQYALDLVALLGWQVKTFGKRFNFIPQAGAGVLYMKITRNNDNKLFFPLIGADFHLLSERYWHFVSSFYYIPLGLREEHIQLFNEQVLPAVKQGFVHGYEVYFRIGYHVTPMTTLFIDYLHMKVKANCRNNFFNHEKFLNLETKWLSNRLEVGFGYIF